MEDQATVHVKLGPAADVRVVRRMDDGSGVVEVPLIKAGQEIDLSLTAGGNKGTWKVKQEDLQEMEANGKRYPATVPWHLEHHRPWSETGGEAPAHLERLVLRGDTLYAHIWAEADLFHKIGRQWRGVSGDFARNMKHPTVTLEGWSVYGGVFTNRPAAQGATFKVAASSEAIASVSFELRPPLMEQAEEENEMDEKKSAPEATVRSVSLEMHEAKIAKLSSELGEQVQRAETFQAKYEQATNELASLRSKLTETEARAAAADTEKDVAKATSTNLQATVNGLRDAKRILEEKLVDLTARLTNEENANASIRVQQKIDLAVKAGVAPAVFDGSDAKGTTPAEWAKATYGSLDAFEAVADRLMSVGSTSGLPSSGTKSGHDPKSTDSAASAKLAQHEQVIANNLGLTGKYDGVTTEQDARKVFEQNKKS